LDSIFRTNPLVMLVSRWRFESHQNPLKFAGKFIIDLVPYYGLLSHCAIQGGILPKKKNEANQKMAGFENRAVMYEFAAGYFRDPY